MKAHRHIQADSVESNCLRCTGGDGESDEGLLCEEDVTVTVRDSLDALLQVRCTSLAMHPTQLPANSLDRHVHLTIHAAYAERCAC